MKSEYQILCSEEHSITPHTKRVPSKVHILLSNSIISILILSAHRRLGMIVWGFQANVLKEATQNKDVHTSVLLHI
jgi:hypothetical protein